MREIDLEGHIYDRTKTMKDDQWRVQTDLVIERSLLWRSSCEEAFLITYDFYKCFDDNAGQFFSECTVK